MTDEIDLTADAPKALMRVEGADDTTIDGRWKYARTVAGAGDAVPKGLWSHQRNVKTGQMENAPSAAKIMVVQEVARMLGFHPIAGLMHVHIIEGRPSMSAAIMAAKVRSAGHRLRIGARGKIADGSLTGFAHLIRKDDPEYTYEVEWTLDDATRAELGTLTRSADGTYEFKATKDNWRKYPRAMLKARAIAEVCREGAEDELMGAAYIPDELGANTDEDGAFVDAPAKPSRDWDAAIAAVTTLDEAAALREELRDAPDYTAALWGKLLARVGMLKVDEPPADEHDREPDEEIVYEHDGTEAGADETSKPADGTPKPGPGPRRVSTDDTAAGVDDPDWKGEPCPRCGGKHDPSVHDGDEE